jgi:MAST domain-containing protein
MKNFCILSLGATFILLVGIASASNQYGSMDVYYNNKLLPGKEIAKPILKIGEPFNIKIYFTPFQKCYISVKLSELDKDDFIITEGPTLSMEKYFGKIIEQNSTETFEWTVKPTDKWAGGSIPINFVYQIDELGAGGKTLVNSEFTVAYCTISNEHYKGKVSTPKEQKTSEKEPSPTSKPASMPDFSSVSTIAALSLAFLAFYRQAL